MTVLRKNVLFNSLRISAVFLLLSVMALGMAQAAGRRPSTPPPAEPLPVPQNVRVSNVTDQWYSISWDRCGNSGWFRIDLQEISPNGHSTTRNQSVNGRQFQFSNLRPGHEYRVKVRYLKSRDGRVGEPSQAVTFYSAPAPVQNLRLTTSTSRELFLSWDPAISAGEGEMAYRVELEPVSSDASQNQSVEVTQESVAFRNLERDTEYRIRVLALGREGARNGIHGTGRWASLSVTTSPLLASLDRSSAELPRELPTELSLFRRDALEDRCVGYATESDTFAKVWVTLNRSAVEPVRVWVRFRLDITPSSHFRLIGALAGENDFKHELDEIPVDFLPGETRKEIQVPLKNDNFKDGVKVVLLSLANDAANPIAVETEQDPINNDSVRYGAYVGHLFIEDDGDTLPDPNLSPIPPEVSLVAVADDTSCTEGDVTPFTLSVRSKSGAISGKEIPVSLQVTHHDGTVETQTVKVLQPAGGYGATSEVSVGVRTYGTLEDVDFDTTQLSVTLLRSGHYSIPSGALTTASKRVLDKRVYFTSSQTGETFSTRAPVAMLNPAREITYLLHEGRSNSLGLFFKVYNRSEGGARPSNLPSDLRWPLLRNKSYGAIRAVLEPDTATSADFEPGTVSGAYFIGSQEEIPEYVSGRINFLRLLDDSIGEKTERCVIRLVPSPGMEGHVVMGRHQARKIEIRDNDPLPTLSLNARYNFVYERHQVNVRLTAKATQPVDLPATVNSFGNQMTSCDSCYELTDSDKKRLLPCPLSRPWYQWSETPDEDGLYTATSVYRIFYAETNLKPGRETWSMGLLPGDGYLIDENNDEVSVTIAQFSGPEVGLNQLGYTIEDGDTSLAMGVLFKDAFERNVSFVVRVSNQSNPGATATSKRVVAEAASGRNLEFSMPLPEYEAGDRLVVSLEYDESLPENDPYRRWLMIVKKYASATIVIE